MRPVDYPLLALALLGHVVFWVAAVNRLHAFALPRPALKAISACGWLGLFAIPFFLLRNFSLVPLSALDPARAPLLIYLALAALFGLYAIGRHAWEMLVPRDRPAALLATRTLEARSLRDRENGSRSDPSPIDRPLVHGRLCRALARLPGNQLLDLQVREFQLRLERLPAALDRLSIAHLSDLHMSGRLDKAYYEEVCRLTNEADPDLIVIAGDLFDAEACLDWVPDTLARLRARHGVYFVFGNHDLRVNHARARRVLTEAGLIDLGGCWRQIAVAGAPLLLAGNELPWFKPAANLAAAPVEHDGAPIFRLLLAHAPDQIGWARRNQVDLMLAGHTHGGQIRFPLLGPVVAPSRYGTRYASGMFQVGATLMHVGRGAGTLDPLRWNCPPEIGLLTLRSAAALDAVNKPASTISHHV